MVHFFTLITPLLSSLYIFFNGLYLGSKGSPFIGILSISFSWLSCLFWFYQGFFYVDLGSWFTVGIFSVHWSFNFNSLSWVMCITVSTVSLIVHIFSFFYMYKDPHINRFFSYLNLFTFFMLFLIVSNNLILMFWGWEGVGICSFLLINFWYTRIAANKSALKAVFINKISDIFFLYGIILFILEFNTTEIPVILCLVPFLKKKVIYCCGLHFFLLDIISLFLTLGSFGKSAQMGLHLWLPDAMEGPTPVSALIHAATMVTAGVFLLLRLSLLFDYSPFILKIILFLGSFTALISSLIGSFQYDVKKIIAYSTCSQLGYMFVACGFSNYSLSLFHLFNHAFFKSLLFLSSGLVIHSLHTQDIRKFEKKKITNNLILILFLVPSFSLCGFPFLSGSFSKENIIKLSLHTGFVNGDLVYLFLLLTAAITSFYSVKLLYFIYSPKTTYFFYSWKPLFSTGDNYSPPSEWLCLKPPSHWSLGWRKDLPNCPYHSRKYLLFDYIEYFANEYQSKVLYRYDLKLWFFFIRILFMLFCFFITMFVYLVNWLETRLLHYLKLFFFIFPFYFLLIVFYAHFHWWMRSCIQPFYLFQSNCILCIVIYVILFFTLSFFLTCAFSWYFPSVLQIFLDFCKGIYIFCTPLFLRIQKNRLVHYFFKPFIFIFTFYFLLIVFYVHFPWWMVGCLSGILCPGRCEICIVIYVILFFTLSFFLTCAFYWYFPSVLLSFLDIYFLLIHKNRLVHYFFKPFIFIFTFTLTFYFYVIFHNACCMPVMVSICTYKSAAECLLCARLYIFIFCCNIFILSFFLTCVFYWYFPSILLSFLDLLYLIRKGLRYVLHRRDQLYFLCIKIPKKTFLYLPLFFLIGLGIYVYFF